MLTFVLATLALAAAGILLRTRTMRTRRFPYLAWLPRDPVARLMCRFPAPVQPHLQRFLAQIAHVSVGTPTCPLDLARHAEIEPLACLAFLYMAQREGLVRITVLVRDTAGAVVAEYPTVLAVPATVPGADGAPITVTPDQVDIMFTTQRQIVPQAA